MLWDLNEGKHLYTLDAGDGINAMCFSPNRYWLCAASGPQVKIWVSGIMLFYACRLPITDIFASWWYLRYDQLRITKSAVLKASMRVWMKSLQPFTRC